MAHIDTTRMLVAGRPFGSRLAHVFHDLAASLSAWNDARVTRNALRKLSDHELDDLGLSRGEVEMIGR